MSTIALNRILLAIFAALAVLTWVVQRDLTQPNNLFFMPNMVHSIPYDSFASNPVYADGKTLQLPVEGSVARGEVMLDYEATEADALRAGEELVNPWNDPSIDASSLLATKDRGRKIYARFCLPCHGAVGNGDGPVATRGFPPPPSLSAEKSLKMSDGQMFHVLSFGQKNMPSYAAQISAADRWAAILHIRALQEPTVLKAEEDRKHQASIEVGKQAFERLSCRKCHAIDEGDVPAGPDLRKIAGVYTREQLLDAIVYPSKSIAAGFTGQLFLTDEGTVHSGIVIKETDDEVTLRDAKGDDVTIPVDGIEERKTLDKSAMPEGLIKDVADDEVQSMLDYLKSIAVEPPIAVEPSAAVEPPIK